LFMALLVFIEYLNKDALYTSTATFVAGWGGVSVESVLQLVSTCRDVLTTPPMGGSL